MMIHRQVKKSVLQMIETFFKIMRVHEKQITSRIYGK